MSKPQKIIAAIPFLIMCWCVAASWFDFISGPFIPQAVHYVTLGAVLINGILYFIRFRAAVWMTGAILLGGVANVISFSSDIDTFSIMGSPRMEFRSVMILIVYGIIDFGVFGRNFFRERLAED